MRKMISLKKPRQIHSGLSDRATTWAFLLPTFVVLCITAFAPLAYSFWLSFNSFKLNQPNATPVFIGLQNYIELFHDERFWIATWNTTIFACGTVILELFFGVLLAMFLCKDSKFNRIAISIFLIPMIMAPVASGTLWRMMMDHTTGVVNYFLSLIGIEPIAFLGDVRYALASVMFVDVWRLTPWVTILVVSALKGIPGNTIEAAVIDGASKFKVFRYIVLPYLKPVVIIVLMLRLVDAFKVFDTVYVMTSGGPGTATSMLPNFIYNQGLKYFNGGYSAAAAFVFLFAMTLVSVVFIRIRNRVNDETR